MLITGPLWAAKAWGVYWTWDPRLTTSMLSVLLYVAYVVLRLFAGDGDAERKFAAALGVLGAANLPIIHFSVQKWGGNHPKVITGGRRRPPAPGHEDRRSCSASSAFTLLAVVLLWCARAHRPRVVRASPTLEQEALELGIGEDDP